MNTNVLTALADAAAAIARARNFEMGVSDPQPAPDGDGFDLTTAIQHDGPAFTHWKRTATITDLHFSSEGVLVEFDRNVGPLAWPNVRPAGWDGDLQFSIGMAMRLSGDWHVAAPIQCWQDAGPQGGNIGDASVRNRDGQVVGQVAANWFYDLRWGPMMRQPLAGEPIGFFVVAGSVRGASPAIGVAERSNVVIVPFPTVAGADHVFGGGA